MGEGQAVGGGQQPSVSVLPEELYYHIFTFTTWPDVCRLASCNRMFHRLASHPQLLRLTAPEVASVSLPELVAELPSEGMGCFVRDSGHAIDGQKCYSGQGYFQVPALSVYDQLSIDAVPTDIITLPCEKEGTSLVLLNGIIYFYSCSQKPMPTAAAPYDLPMRLIAFDLRNNRVMAERELVEVACNNAFSLQWGGYSFIQLGHDEVC
eukprot:TRINITY_DN6602_c0_g2_i1.p1 TRINITY_DN6602_c0_g2~~TRINITY_DN6602_c0_g2_i1.p1  ORF type:complete len:208 (-),score=14.33 TRINITY_DN6602_c0_g2_i1:237-860(-)